MYACMKKIQLVGCPTILGEVERSVFNRVARDYAVAH